VKEVTYRQKEPRQWQPIGSNQAYSCSAIRNLQQKAYNSKKMHHQNIHPDLQNEGRKRRRRRGSMSRRIHGIYRERKQALNRQP
jgi:hypothetical protein